MLNCTTSVVTAGRIGAGGDFRAAACERFQLPVLGVNHGGGQALAGGMYSLILAIALILFRPRVSLSCS
jgi:hypothetical protein